MQLLLNKEATSRGKKKDEKKEVNEEINTDDNDLLNKVSNLMNLQ